MTTIERISRATGLLLTVACGLIVSACASVESTPAPALAATGAIAVLLLHERFESGRELEPPFVIDLGGEAAAKHFYSTLFQKTPRR